MADNCSTEGIGFICPIGCPPKQADCALPGNLETCNTSVFLIPKHTPCACRAYFEVTNNTVQSCFGFSDLQGVSKTNWRGRVSLIVWRRGTETKIGEYTPWSIDEDGRVCFLWDDAFINAASGLYEAQLKLDCEVRACVCLKKTAQKYKPYNIEHIVNSGCSVCGACGELEPECECPNE